MHKPIPAFSYLNLGEVVAYLRNPHIVSGRAYLDDVQYFLNVLRNLDLSNTAIAAAPLGRVDSTRCRRIVTETTRLQLAAMVDPIYAQLTSETNARLSIHRKQAMCLTSYAHSPTARFVPKYKGICARRRCSVSRPERIEPCSNGLESCVRRCPQLDVERSVETGCIQFGLDGEEASSRIRNLSQRFHDV